MYSIQFYTILCTILFSSLLFSLLSSSSSKLDLVEASCSPVKTQCVLGSCHSLSFLNGEIIGDPLEKAALLAVGWRLSKSESYYLPPSFPSASSFSSLPPPSNFLSPSLFLFLSLTLFLSSNFSGDSVKGPKCSLSILHRFHFSSSLKRMSTVSSMTLPNVTHLACVKGAPEVIKTMVREGDSK